MTREDIVSVIGGVESECGMELYFVLDDDSIKFARIKEEVTDELKIQLE